MYCLDTNIIVGILRGDENAINSVKQAVSRGERLAITWLTVCELYKGVFQTTQPSEHKKQVDSLIASLATLDFNADACMFYGKTYAILKKSGKLTQEFDLLIASIAVAHRCTLVTRNLRDFTNIPELSVVSW